MLPIVDKPLIQYAVEEALAAGVEKLVFVTGASKRAIEDHFDSNAELERSLEASGKLAMLESVRAIVPKHVTCIYIRQSEPLGLGHAVLCARPVVGDEPFAVHLADDLIDSEVPCLSQMAEVFGQRGGSVLGVQTVPRDQTEKYGVVEVEPAGERVGKVHAIVEKPKPEDAPSNLAVVGRYILTPRIFELIGRTNQGTGGEIQLTDAIGALLEEQHVFAFEFEGTRYDCGSKLGYLKASVEYGLNHPTLGDDFREYLYTLVRGD